MATLCLMKTKTNPIHDMNTSTLTVPQSNPAVSAPPPVVRHDFQLGLDVDLRFVVTAIQCDHGVIKPAQKWTRAQLVAWVRAQVAAPAVAAGVARAAEVAGEDGRGRVAQEEDGRGPGATTGH